MSSVSGWRALGCAVGIPMPRRNKSRGCCGSGGLLGRGHLMVTPLGARRTGSSEPPWGRPAAKGKPLDLSEQVASLIA